MRQVLLACMVCGGLWAQAPNAPEPLTGWRFYKQVEPPRNDRGLAGLLLDRDVLNEARADEADLRLYDRAGREIPYVLRIRRNIRNENVFATREYNRATEGGAAQISCDLGGEAAEHNEVEVETAGDNFRRLATVDGSADGERWSTLVSGAILFRFTAEGRTVQKSDISYPVSRFRYLRVRVGRDPEVDRAAPEIQNVRVRRSVHVEGEMASFPAMSVSREPDRFNGRPASVWRIDLGGRVPVSRLMLNINEGVFSRPFQLDVIDDPSSPAGIASGELTRTEDGPYGPLNIDFTERRARRLKLTVVDDRNAPLALLGVTALAAAREGVFVPPAGRGALRLYYGNGRALAPRYDLAARLPADAKPSARAALGPQMENPAYRPEPKPFSERSPWLAYLILAAACVVLAAILVNPPGPRGPKIRPKRSRNCLIPCHAFGVTAQGVGSGRDDVGTAARAGAS